MRPRPALPRRAGFSVLELLLALVLVGTLAALVLAKFAQAKERAYVAALKSDLKSFATQAELYADQHAGYPATVAALADGGTWRFSPDVAPVGYRATGGESLEILLGHGKTTTLCALRLGTAQGAGAIVCAKDLTLDFQVSDRTPAAGTPVRFDATIAIQQLAFGPSAPARGTLYAADPSEIATVAWDFGDGTTVAGPPATTTVVEHRYTTPGDYTVRLALTRVAGPLAQGSKTLEVAGTPTDGTGGATGGPIDTVPTAPATRPVALATAHPASAYVGEVITLDGSGSTGVPLSTGGFQWRLSDGAAAEGMTAGWTARAPGTYTAWLIVTSAEGVIDSASVVITVPNRRPQAVFAWSPGDPVAWTAIAFTAAASSDPDGGVLRFAWDSDEWSEATGETPWLSFSTPGAHTVRLVVEDPQGAADTLTRTVTVGVPRPTARFTTTPALAAPDTPITVDAAASSTPAGTLSSYAWSFGDGATATGVQASHAYGAQGTYTVRLVVTNSFGGADTVARAVSVAYPTTAAFAWGHNADGEVGDGNSSNPRLIPTAVTGGFAFTQIAAGNYYFTCALTAAGAAYCWGTNESGQLGVNSSGTYDRRLTPTPVLGGLSFTTLTTANGHVCGLIGDGRAYCWGRNDYGQIGDGTVGTNRLVPTPVGGGLAFVQITARAGHTCGLTADGTAYCWGRNDYGQIGNTTTGGPRSAPTPVAGGLRFTKLVAGSSSTCGLTAAGIAYCWGYNGSGSIGDGTTVNRAQPTRVAGGLTFATLSAGSDATCGLTSAGVAYCWGMNPYGGLGDGTKTNRSTPTLVAGGLTFASITVGGGHTCGLTADGAAYCWGYNNYGEVGDNSSGSDRVVPTLVAGGLRFRQLSAGSLHTVGLLAP